MPVIGRHNRPAAALSVATLTFRYSMQELEVRPALEGSRKGGRGAVALRQVR